MEETYTIQEEQPNLIIYISGKNTSFSKLMKLKGDNVPKDIDAAIINIDTYIDEEGLSKISRLKRDNVSEKMIQDATTDAIKRTFLRVAQKKSHGVVIVEMAGISKNILEEYHTIGKTLGNHQQTLEYDDKANGSLRKVLFLSGDHLEQLGRFIWRSAKNVVEIIKGTTDGETLVKYIEAVRNPEFDMILCDTGVTGGKIETFKDISDGYEVGNLTMKVATIFSSSYLYHVESVKSEKERHGERSLDIKPTGVVASKPSDIQKFLNSFVAEIKNLFKRNEEKKE